MSENEYKDEVFRIYKSKKGPGFVTYLPTGKVVLVSRDSKVHEGYGRIISYVEKERYLIAKMENVICDYYPGISYDELKKVLRLRGFVFEYSEPIDEENEFAVWANLNNGALVVIATWNDYETGDDGFSSIDLYVTTEGHILSKCLEDYGFSFGSYYIHTFNLASSTVDFSFGILLRLSKGPDWHGNTPSLWHYGDGDSTDNPLFFSRALSRLFKFKHDLNKLFNMQAEKNYAYAGIKDLK